MRVQEQESTPCSSPTAGKGAQRRFSMDLGRSSGLFGRLASPDRTPVATPSPPSPRNVLPRSRSEGAAGMPSEIYTALQGQKTPRSPRGSLAAAAALLCHDGDDKKGTAATPPGLDFRPRDLDQCSPRNLQGLWSPNRWEDRCTPRNLGQTWSPVSGSLFKMPAMDLRQRSHSPSFVCSEDWMSYSSPRLQPQYPPPPRRRGGLPGYGREQLMSSLPWLQVPGDECGDCDPLDFDMQGGKKCDFVKDESQVKRRLALDLSQASEAVRTQRRHDHPAWLPQGRPRGASNSPSPCRGATTCTEAAGGTVPLSHSAAMAFGAAAAPWAVDVAGVPVNVVQPKYIVGHEVTDWSGGRRTASASHGWRSPRDTVNPAGAHEARFREHRNSEDIREHLQPPDSNPTPTIAGLGSGLAGQEVVGVMMQQTVNANPVVSWAMDLRGGLLRQGGSQPARPVAYEVVKFARRGPGVFSPCVFRVPVTSASSTGFCSPRKTLITTSTAASTPTKVTTPTKATTPTQTKTPTKTVTVSL